ncbi:DUF2788 domain-containing protein [Alteromonadaceae bacterium M269]|nr:DUF2788 domain-containing protein [Alteromonadaceae bacterium M269]
MLNDNYEKIEAMALNLSLAVLFLLMGLAVHDVLKKNKVPMVGRVATYFVLFLGMAGFLAKGLIQYFWQSSGVG